MKLIDVTQDWDTESTTYWFALGDEVYGVIESGAGSPVFVDQNGMPLDDHDCIAAAVTDAMRKAAAGL
jgi:hypothetical protein